MNLLLTGAFKYTKGQLDDIQDLGFDITFVQDERVSLSEANQNINIAAIEAVVCNGLFLYNDITQFKSLKFIQLTSAGMDKLQQLYQNHGIHIANARGVYSIPMAEWVVLKIWRYIRTAIFTRRMNGATTTYRTLARQQQLSA